MSRTRESRIADYVDSPALGRRVKLGETIDCEIAGTLGTYCVRSAIRSTGDFECTCPSEIIPCKHIEALRATYRQRPESFIDVGPVLAHLSKQPKEALLSAVEKAALDAPSVLGLLGLVQFPEDEDENGKDLDDD